MCAVKIMFDLTCQSYLSRVPSSSSGANVESDLTVFTARKGAIGRMG